MARIKQAADIGEERITDKVASMALDLRRLADRIVEEGKPRTLPNGTRITAAYRVARILHEITWTVANLTSDGLIDMMVDADTPREDEA